MWAGNSREGKKYHSEPPPTLADAATHWPFRIFFVIFVAAQNGERGSDAECFQCFSWLKIARLLGHILRESGFPTIVSSLVARYWQSRARMCAWRTDAAYYTERCRQRGSLTIVLSFYRRGRQRLQPCYRLDWFYASFVVAVLVSLCCRPGFFFKCGSSRCGLASAVSGSSEQQACMPWAVCSPSQRTGEMLLKGQWNWFVYIPPPWPRKRNQFPGFKRLHTIVI